MDFSTIEENGDIYDDIDVVKRIKIQRLRWLGHVLRMDSSNPVREVFESKSASGSRRKGRPRQRWAKQVDWHQAATARDVWRRKLAEDKTYGRL